MVPVFTTCKEDVVVHAEGVIEITKKNLGWRSYFTVINEKEIKIFGNVFEYILTSDDEFRRRTGFISQYGDNEQVKAAAEERCINCLLKDYKLDLQNKNNTIK